MTVPGQITPKGLTRMSSPDLKPKESMLQVVLLEKQIKEFELRLLQTSQKLRESEERQGWMQKFIVSFVNMA